MKKVNKTYWKGLEQLTNDTEFVKNAQNEFPEVPGEGEDAPSRSRRDFLKMMGFSLAAASLAACEAPIRKAIPYLNKPVDVDPGIPNYYASTYFNGGDVYSVVVKTREGRPIKLDGNKHGVAEGATTGQVEASVLNLYDTNRLQNPKKGEADITWETLDAEVKSKLSSIQAKGGKIAVVSETVNSPSIKKALKKFADKYQNVEHVMYDPISEYGVMAAHKATFGVDAVPSYDLTKADVIVSVASDFLGSRSNSGQFSKAYGKIRKVSKDNPEMSRHYQFESNLSLTGANADYRTPIKPSQEGFVVGQLYNLLAKKAGAAPLSGVSGAEVANLEKAANDLWKAKGKSLVIAGSNDPDVQIVVNAINNLLTNYGSTINIDKPAYYRLGNDRKMNAFVSGLAKGEYSAVIFYNANPVYNHPKGDQIASALSKVELSVATNGTSDETSSLSQYIAPDHHFLEAWNDAEPVKGHFTLGQPAIRPLFKTRNAGESFLAWSGETTSYYDFLRNNWKEGQFAAQSSTGDFDQFWNETLYKGVFAGDVQTAEITETATSDEAPATEGQSSTGFTANLAAVASRIKKNYKASSSNIELALYTNGTGNGSMANNPWLQEMPDPITKATWDNYLTVSQSFARENGLEMKEGQTVTATLKVGGQTMEVPVLIQPGQAKGTMGLALGYGRKKAGKVGNEVGVNAYPLLAVQNEFVSFNVTEGVTVEPTGNTYKIAQTQTHETVMDRDSIIKEATLKQYKKDPNSVVDHPEFHTSEGKKRPEAITLWDGHDYNNHHWGLAIDLNSCTGCSACHIACQVENNIPVVGKEEVLNRREMHWIRIDRYYSSPESADSYDEMENAADNPEVVFQPMMCQHCNNAPCETVCPVAATTHSSEGLNQMTYNRCIGTRYCANNCPYKVRRFNWFKYHDNKQFDKNTAQNSALGKMVLNPDVTVRARGVMEKCSLCVQRIQSGKLKAKTEGRRPNDEDVTTACAAACPSDAIVFGDLKNEDSKIHNLLKIRKAENDANGMEIGEERAYAVLEELRVDPNVFYFAKIRNKDEA
ncbi:TAT-variant-translocated molybdopterin oxidoreductase [Mangrovivirga sp. M17]|uniref:TAT-variant-translocated molybdopterin oxidoreductase n=1 Tax=Mangrovivirga halotolerans TaxID=2993936 RepID=A0ABT3RL99_9BACT|nr:TAT-variant-translocated molybdopterin oxidoreductase [Mangrovivirga halotolerans]MCX2742586.1 TAT-variant-translocated molybdopterin oxidoreductase [Mangrovivirga halotolerans]